MHYLYLILCKNESIYTGVTDNLERRFTEHKTKSGGWHTKLYPAIKVLRTEEFETKIEALKREKQIKGWRREKKLNLIKFGKPILM
jgi:putative endonuclease